MSDHLREAARSGSAGTPAEARVLLLVAAVQFVNILDFMMVMPLGPDFARALDIPTSHLGYIGGSYTASAAVSGLIGALFLDRFDRRSALAVAMLGLAIGTAAGAFSVGLKSLLLARVVAGAFGGPATSLSLSIVADIVPPERRGKAMGVVMSSFAVASVFGVPAGLELAHLGSWRTPFYAVAMLGVLATFATATWLPPMRAHLLARGDRPQISFAALAARPVVLLSWLTSGVVMISGFLLIPNIASYMQFNLSYPRARLGILYLVGGTASFLSVRFVGRLVDRYGSSRTGTFGALGLIVVLWVWFYDPPHGLPMVVVFTAFMVAMSIRNVSHNTLSSLVPEPDERARFMSIQSAVQHLASATGAFVSAKLLTELPDHKLVGIPRLTIVAIAFTAVTPILLILVESRVRARTSVARGRAEPTVDPVPPSVH